MAPSRLLTRREFLAAGGAAAALAALPPMLRGSGKEPRVVIVGAGLAGMTAALRIWQQAGVTPTVLEAHDGIGGRTRTIRGLAGDLIAEAGGTFISTGDGAVRGLAKEMGLSLIDLNKIYPAGRATYLLRGKRRRGADVYRDEATTARNAERHFEHMRWPATYDNANAANERWDAMSVAEWIDRFTPHGLDSLYGSYLRAYFEGEYGGPIDEASSIQLIADYAAPGRSYDERFQLRGGSDRLVHRVRERLPAGTVATGTALKALLRLDNGRYELQCSAPEGDIQVVADHVVLALPFTALRDVAIDPSLGFSERKLKAISDQGMGQNSKVNLVFERPTWSPPYNGESLTDLVVGTTWPGHAGQSGPKAIVVGFNGPESLPVYADEAVHGRLSEVATTAHLAAIDEIFPNASSSFIDGEAYLDTWTRDPWIKGSYSFDRIGAFTSYSGIEARPVGNVFFAGEHTAAYGNSGTMNGAVSSGERAATEVLKALKTVVGPR